MMSKTKISKRTERKTNPELVDTIFFAKKNNHIELAALLSRAARQEIKKNLTDLNNSKEKIILVPGKILGSGDVKKKMIISALSFSEQAKEKLKKAGCEIKTIKNEIKENPGLKGVEILR